MCYTQSIMRRYQKACFSLQFTDFVTAIVLERIAKHCGRHLVSVYLGYITVYDCNIKLCISTRTMCTGQRVQWHKMDQNPISFMFFLVLISVTPLKICSYSRNYTTKFLITRTWKSWSDMCMYADRGLECRIIARWTVAQWSVPSGQLSSDQMKKWTLAHWKKNFYVLKNTGAFLITV